MDRLNLTKYFKTYLKLEFSKLAKVPAKKWNVGKQNIKMFFRSSV